MPPMYPTNFVSYAPQQYYSIPPQYSSSGIPSPGYLPYQQYARSPPTMHQYVPMVGVSVSPNYPRASQQSPSLATPYQPPPAPVPIPPQTPSSTHSSHMIPPPTPPTPSTPQAGEYASSAQHPQPVASPPISERKPFLPPLPWLSMPESKFPKRTPRLRTKRKLLPSNEETVFFSLQQHGAILEKPPTAASQHSKSAEEAKHTSDADAREPAEHNQAEAEPRNQNTDASNSNAEESVAQPKDAHQPATAVTNGNDDKDAADGSALAENAAGPSAQEAGTPGKPAVASTSVRAAPISWAKLFSPVNQAAFSSNGLGRVAVANGEQSRLGNISGSDFHEANKSSLAEVIRNFQVNSTGRVALIEPRGLINAGNMCYMNSVLQVLVFCTPFYDFLEKLSKRGSHSFNSSTPLVDILVVFMQEFKVLASGSSAELCNSVKTEMFERYGEPFTPEFVYDAIRKLSRFASMEHGHQQDAEEFLGFLLQSLDDECSHIMGQTLGNEEQPMPEVPAQQNGTDASGDWLEVGRKQKAAVTRSSGSKSSSPITKIFGGLLRSELRVPGLKDSITTEPYQPLQLDIGSPDVRNVVDALRGLTRPERLQGDFNSPRGKDVMATKQVFIETLPPVLILHLKRFQFDAEGHGTIKIWKKIGYPLELGIPREALSRQRRQIIGEGPMPRYKLISVVYHHGKNASGGHYTVDVRRQDGREWIRMDDTVLRRIRSEDVAEAGSEDDAADICREQSPASNASTNRFGVMHEQDAAEEDGWKQVTTSATGSKRWSNVANGANAAGSKEKQVKDSNSKDNKVAYLLLYQRM